MKKYLKINLQACYGVGKFKEDDRIVDISYSNGSGTIIKDVDGTLFVVQFDNDPKGNYKNVNVWDIEMIEGEE